MNTLQAAGYVKLENRTLVTVEGTDRLAWLNNFCTNDLASRDPGEGCEAFVLDARGRTLAHCLILVTANALHLVMTGKPETSLVDHLERYVIREDVRLQDVSDQCSLYWIDDTDRFRSSGDPRPADWSHLPLDDQHRLVYSRIGDQPDGLLLGTGAAPERSLELLAGQGLALQPGVAFDRQRVRGCWPLNGTDLTADNLPQEFRRDSRAISFTKGCYLGQETVARIDALGHVNRFLARLELDPGLDEARGRPFFAEGGGDKPAGTLTSIVPMADNSLAGLGFVRCARITPDARFQLDGKPLRLIGE